MSRRLCIVLQSVYSSAIPNHEKWNEEVDTDAETVKEVLYDHDILEIVIPHLTKSKIFTALIDKKLHSLSQRYESCHIVLNTHGIAGMTDLPDDVVKQTLLTVSTMNIAVTQISALQCHGMSVLSIQEQRERVSMRSLPSTLREKPPSLLVLQQKLTRTHTAIPQNFPIHGVAQAYEPDTDKELVVSILKGESPSLQVFTAEPIVQSQEAYLEEINQSIQMIRSTPIDARIGNLQYDKAGNRLAKALEAIKENISDYLQNIRGLHFESKLLLAQLAQCAQEIGSVLNAKNLNVIFKRWSKEHKIHSEARLDILQTYHDRLSASSPGASLADRDTDARIMASIGLHARKKIKDCVTSYSLSKTTPDLSRH